MFDGTVATSAGRVRGVDVEGCWSFLGLPYAAPVSGAARFAPPVPPESWSGVRDADDFSPIAPQPQSGLGSYVPGDPMLQGEDCLALNIWTTDCSLPTRPVLVFLHGGAFLSGAGSSVMYRGDTLARQGLVVVTVNYRLGVLGFLAHPALDLPGYRFANRGLLDQIAALEWVRDNIAGFGGDPHNVTVAGESAGAMSIADLLSLEHFRGLVHRAVLESGSTEVEEAAPAFARAERFAGLLGLRSVDLGALSAAPIQELLAAQDVIATEMGGAASMPFRPVLDRRLFARHPDVAWAKGATVGVDLLLGTNRDEFRFFTFAQEGVAQMDDDRLVGLVQGYLGPAGIVAAPNAVIDAYRAAREELGLASRHRDLFEAIGTDLVFRAPLLRMASAHTGHGGRCFVYRFDWESPFAQGVLGACHALELPFVFGTLDNPVVAMFSGSGPEAERVAAEVQASWVAFASSGDPSNELAGEWPAYEELRRATRVFGSEPKVLDAPGERERRFLEDVLPRFGGIDVIETPTAGT